jgi:MFS family permease
VAAREHAALAASTATHTHAPALSYRLTVLLAESPRITFTHVRILALAFCGWMFDFYDLILYTFLTRPITDELGLTHFDHGVALGLSFSATAVGGIVCGLLADRFGRRTVVSWTILLYSAGSLMAGVADSRVMLFTARVVTGLGVGGEWAAGHALVAETFPPASRGRAGAILQTGAPVGVGLATLVGTLIVPRYGWRVVLIASSASALLAFVARIGMPESDVWRAHGTRRFGAGASRLVTGDLARRFWLALLVTTVNGASYWLTYSWMPEYLRSRALGVRATGRVMGVIVAGEIVGYAIYGWFSDRFGRRPAFTAFALIMVAGLLPLTAFWPRLQAAPYALFAACVLVGVGTGTWSNFGPMLAELFPTALRNTGMSAVLNLSRGMQFGGPVLIAALEPRYGLAAGLGLAAAFATVAAGLIWLLPETRAAALRK